MNLSNKAVLLAAVVLGLVSGCGGGSDGASPAAAAVSGTAATGAAIVGGLVSMKCVSGTTGIATTGADGSYVLNVNDSTFPCIGRVDYTDSANTRQKLHTFVTAPGTANITPITELLLASLTGSTSVDAFDKFDAAKLKALNAAQVSAAIAAIKAYLVTLGVSVVDFPADPIGKKLVAKVGSSAGDKADGVLDDLAAKLKGMGKNLGDAVGDVDGAKTPTTIGGANVLTVSAASKSSRNGAYTISGARFAGSAPNPTDFGFNGNTLNGLFETDVVVTTGGVIRYATIWYFDGNNVISFFGCGGSNATACTGVSFDSTGQKVTISDAHWTLTGGSETLTVNGTIVIPK